MIVPVMAISNLVLTRQIYSGETNGAHAHNRDRVPLKNKLRILVLKCKRVLSLKSVNFRLFYMFYSI